MPCRYNFAEVWFGTKYLWGEILTSNFVFQYNCAKISDFLKFVAGEQANLIPIFAIKDGNRLLDSKDFLVRKGACNCSFSPGKSHFLMVLI
jgi:hypothetical protein